MCGYYEMKAAKLLLSRCKFYKLLTHRRCRCVTIESETGAVSTQQTERKNVMKLYDFERMKFGAEVQSADVVGIRNLLNLDDMDGVV